MENIVATQAVINALDRLGEQILGLPRQPDIVVSRYGRGSDPSFGRTTKHAEPRKHPTLDTWSIPVKILRRLWKAYQADTLPPSVKAVIMSLTNAQRTAIRDAIRDAVDLDETWWPASVIAP